MKYKERMKSANIEDRRKGKIKPWYDGLPLSDTFREQIEFLPNAPTVSKRGRKVRVSSKNKIYSQSGGGYRNGS